MFFYAFTVPGLEDLAAGEIEQRVEGRIGEKRPGVLYFASDRAPEELLALGTVEDVFALVARGPVSTEREGLAQVRELVLGAPLFEEVVEVHRRVRPKKVRRVSFRVVAQRSAGRHSYPRRELGKRVARAVEERFPRWRRVEEDALVEVWVLQEREEVVCGVRLSDRNMRHRTYKKASIEASLRPVVARAMAMLSEPREDDVFLDPMCGAGTLLIERGELGRYRQLLGGDIDERAVEAALANIGPRYKPIEIRRWDATQLPLEGGSVSRIACNLPFGRKVGAGADLGALYRGFLGEAARVLRADGIAVLLTSERDVLEKHLRRQNAFYEERVLPIVVLGRKAFIARLRRP